MIHEFVFLIVAMAVFSLVFVIVVIIGRGEIDGVQQHAGDAGIDLESEARASGEGPVWWFVRSG